MVKNAKNITDKLKEQIKEEEEAISTQELTPTENVEEAEQEIQIESPDTLAADEVEEIESLPATPPSASAEEQETSEEPPKENKAWANMRNQVKDAEAKSQALAERLAKLEGREEERMTQATPPEVDSDPMPDQELDPDNFRDWKMRRQDEQIAANTAMAQRTNDAVRLQDEMNGMQRLENNFKVQNKDRNYDEAVSFIKEREKAIIKVTHPNATDAEIDQHLESEKLKVFRKVTNAGGDAVETIFKMAEASGYQGQKNSTPKIPQPNFNNINNNMKKTSNLIGGAPAGKNEGITPESVFKMSMDEIVSGGKEVFKKAHKNVEFV